MTIWDMGETGRTVSPPPASGAAKNLVLIAGPTASGKSALALALAQCLNGEIINADAMQCYRELRVLTARPSEAEERRVPHHLYGVRAATEPANAAWWRSAAQAVLKTARNPIICGGTGLYLSALIHGIADIPEPDAASRQAARALVAAQGSAAAHARLDAQTRAKLNPADSQRVARALEILLATGKGLAHWQAQPATPLARWRPKLLLLDPPRADLETAIAGRFAAMLGAGALEEVRALLAQNLPPDLPLLRAHGVPELSAHLRGELELAAAAARAVLATRQYTKRQMTWFRHQKLVDRADMQIIPSRMVDSTQLSKTLLGDLVNFIKSPG